MKIPAFDGHVNEYVAGPNRGRWPRIYYVNGIRVMPEQHAQEALMLSFHAERPVFGVYNLTGKQQVKNLGATGKFEMLQEVGSVVDFLQCGADWVTSFAAQVGESGTGLVNKGLTGARNLVGTAVDKLNQKFNLKLPTPKREHPIDVAAKLRNTMSTEQRRHLAKLMLSFNKAAKSLFDQLFLHQGDQWIIAHSQGNLVTADALWALSIAYGDEALRTVRVFSLASPTPAWPAGIDHRRKVYGHENDLVTLCDPHNWSWLTKNILNGKFGRVAGDWRVYGSGKIGIEPHDMKLNVFQLNFINRLRRDLGLTEYPTSPSPPKR